VKYDLQDPCPIIPDKGLEDRFTLYIFEYERTIHL
jgi:hypothetical protein